MSEQKKKRDKNSKEITILELFLFVMLIILSTLNYSFSKTVYGKNYIKRNETHLSPQSSKYKNEPAKGYVEYSRIKFIWNDIPYAAELARKEKKLVLLDFWAIWCHWCIKADKQTFTDSDVEHILLKYFINVKVDVSKYPDLNIKYGIRGLPTIVILDLHGHKLGSIVGFKEPLDFVSLLKQFVRS